MGDKIYLILSKLEKHFCDFRLTLIILYGIIKRAMLLHGSFLLCVIQFGVFAVFSQKLLVGAFFNDQAIFDNNDAVCILNC